MNKNILVTRNGLALILYDVKLANGSLKERPLTLSEFRCNVFCHLAFLSFQSYSVEKVIPVAGSEDVNT
jgi:hypothetical protein